MGQVVEFTGFHPEYDQAQRATQASRGYFWHLNGGETGKLQRLRVCEEADGAGQFLDHRL